MKAAELIARILLGGLFFVFGLNGFSTSSPRHRWRVTARPFGDIGVQLLLARRESLGSDWRFGPLSGRYVPFGLTLLGPIVVNILLFHLLLAPAGLPVALVALGLECFLIYRNWDAFKSVFRK